MEIIETEIYTTADAAEFLELTPARVRQFISSGDLAAEDGNKRSAGYDKLIHGSALIAFKKARDEARKKKTQRAA